MPRIKRHRKGFAKMVATRLEMDGAEVSRTKSTCTASDRALGLDLQQALGVFGVVLQDRVKSLGVGLAGGRMRNTDTQKERLAAFIHRVHKFRSIEAAGVSAAKIVRSG